MRFAIEVVSDTVCPWCYIGSTQLALAIRNYKAKHPARADSFTVTWKSFYLDPRAPKISVSRNANLIQKFGPEQVERMSERIRSAGMAVGLKIGIGGRTGSSRDSHRLIWLAGTKAPDLQWKVADALFEAYFAGEKDITDLNVLADAAVRAGLAEREVREFLQSTDDLGGKECDSEAEQARERGVTGVPHVTINETLEIQGAQESLAFLKAFERLVTTEERK